MKKILSISVVLFVTTYGWSIPQAITYQGSLRENTGLPATGTHKIRFEVVESSNNKVMWSMGSDVPITVTNGLFSTTVLPTGFDWGALTAPVLRVYIDDEQLSPDQPVTSTVYALMSQSIVDNAITTSKIANGSVTAQKLDASAFGAAVPPGMTMAFAGSRIPAGWLLCDGSAISRTTYPNLFAAIGVTWGIGDASTTFNLPDLRGRTLIGAGHGSGLSSRNLAQSLGEESHQLTVAEMPSHNHGITDPGHQHETAIGGQGPWGSGPARYPEVGGTGLYSVSSTLSSPVTTGVSVQNNGGDQPHNNMQPSAVINYIIKY